MEHEKRGYEPSVPKPNLPKVTVETIEAEVSESLSDDAETAQSKFDEQMTQLGLENPDLFKWITKNIDHIMETRGEDSAISAGTLALNVYQLLRRQSMVDQMNKELGEKK